MLKKLLKDNIHIMDRVSDWEEALLLKKGFIKEEYIRAIINDVYKYGPYIVLIDGVAMPHSRPENGFIKKSMSLLKVRNRVDFYKTEKKYIYFLL